MKNQCRISPNSALLLPTPQQVVLSSGMHLPKASLPVVVEHVDGESFSRDLEAYDLEIEQQTCRIVASSPQGHFYGEQTLRQLQQIYPEGIPPMEISDWPDYATRGFYHDVSRGKVPSLQTLKGIADTCAFYKLNQLQLYIEHTYAYGAFSEVWAGADPLTEAEIREFDAYCAERHIELVPSFSTFGHFYHFIHTQRFQHLNELERDVAHEPFTWWDAMTHYTLDCRNPESLEVVAQLIREVRPLFRSRKFNICADETFDLGEGKNRAAAEQEGKGALYLEFVLKVIGVVKSLDATPMMWGDVIANHPELIDQLPRDVLLLDWDYSANLSQSNAGALGASGRPYFVCSGTNAWKRFLPDYDVAHSNITELATAGLRNGAQGYLLTDWGDLGHINCLGLSYPTLALAAASAWNVASANRPVEELDKAISVIELGDASGVLFAKLKEASRAHLCSWQPFTYWKQAHSFDFNESWFHAPSGLPKELFEQSVDQYCQNIRKLEELTVEIVTLLTRVKPRDALVATELRCGLEGALALEASAACLLAQHGSPEELAQAPSGTEVAARLRSAMLSLKEVWLLRNKPSEFWRVEEVAEAMIEAFQVT